jgi:hypothetical protein
MQNRKFGSYLLCPVIAGQELRAQGLNMTLGGGVDLARDPALKFPDGLYEAFNSAARSVMSAFGNLFDGQLDFVWTTPQHVGKWDIEARLNRDTA